jgi:ribosomal protein S18 acetylase RimI-like enzyme
VNGGVSLSIKFRNYTNQAGITEDYHRVRKFFIKLGYAEFSYARWDWMITHSYLDKTAVGKIGIWEDNNKIVGIATFDLQPGDAYCLTLPESGFLKEEMLLYAESNLNEGDKFNIIISDQDLDFQDIAAANGYLATAQKESDAIFYLDRTSTSYSLPAGFNITSMNDSYDLYQYLRVLWKGFDHELNGEGDFNFSSKDKGSADKEMKRPNVDLNLKIAITEPGGNFVSYCGMWYDSKLDYAVIEPVVTDPDYRKMGLGKAAVLEGIKRVGELGAKKVLVGSSQQFYYSIGLRPFASSTLWKKN